MAILQQAGQLSPHIPMGSSQPALLHRPQGRTDLLLKLPAAGSPAYVFMGILSTSLGNAAPGTVPGILRGVAALSPFYK